jgi:hypothetical protein
VEDMEREKEEDIRVQVRSPTFSKIREYVDSRVMREKKKLKKTKKHKKHLQ